jgi:nicotinate-nucleotide adenylyltransferase
LRLGVLGGTFDPIHVGHLILAECAREQFGLATIRFIPAGDPWRKANRKITAKEHRLAMTRLAIDRNSVFEVDPREVQRSGPSYTSETLDELRAGLQAGDELYFLLGEDALEDLPHWHDADAIFNAATVAVAPRGEAAAEPVLTAPRKVERIDMPYVGISSTDLRERVRRGQSIRYMVPAEVEAYIRDNALYREA